MEMTDYSVRRLALILAVQAEIDAMKAENRSRRYRGMSIANGEDLFAEKAEELRNLAHTHDLQLFG